MAGAKRNFHKENRKDKLVMTSRNKIILNTLSHLWAPQEILVINRGNKQGVNKDNYHKISLRRDAC